MGVQIGEKAPDFLNLKGVDGKTHSLSDYSEKILVFIFSCNHCPYVKAYEDRYNLIHSDYVSKGVQFIVINSNDAVKYPDDSFDNMVKRAQEKNYQFPYLYDEDQSVARKFAASNTPHVFVLDESRTVKYTGRIDDNWEDADAVQEHDLRNALNAVINNQEPPVTSTLPVGCSIKWK